jgi:hypothetical protein
MLVRVKALNWGNSPTPAEHGNKGLKMMMICCNFINLENDDSSHKRTAGEWKS